MLHDFGIAKPGDTRVERLVALNHFLIERHRAGQNTVVIVDEAQHLDPPTLERIRLLSNFETTTEKLLQIVLGGQPELDAHLAVPELRQLRQRIGLHCTIPPLQPDETRDYIRTRLRIAGARDLNLFTDRAVRRITEHAAGIPRVINMLLYWEALRFACDRGYHWFDFGRSTPGGSHHRFKAQWGATAVPLYWHYWQATPGPVPERNPQNPRYQLAIRMWRRLPLPMTRMLGPLLARSLA